ncbi:hypothetical protein AQJ66_16605 [Streptomyces bungoensis]|uniref:Uncharacterized protein n=1 Tax=Streptomyces bungoensis TaxID=285568 RepID=A0A124I3N2_9ACTN|nr:hypothetical protein [Streptomyces bungoensis]KUN83804.1 hypothetical protein AQJ66_16605 [Streptomyces bungoensis]
MPPAPAAPICGTPAGEPADRRWCEPVPVGFHDSGGTAACSGTLAFGTYAFGALGVDRETAEPAVDLPAPIPPGAREQPAWTVRVDERRVGAVACRAPT